MLHLVGCVYVCVQNTFRINGETHSLYTVMLYRMARSFKNIKHRRNSLFTKKYLYSWRRMTISHLLVVSKILLS